VIPTDFPSRCSRAEQCLTSSCMSTTAKKLSTVVETNLPAPSDIGMPRRVLHPKHSRPPPPVQTIGSSPQRHAPVGAHQRAQYHRTSRPISISTHACICNLHARQVKILKLTGQPTGLFSEKRPGALRRLIDCSAASSPWLPGHFAVGIQRAGGAGAKGPGKDGVALHWCSFRLPACLPAGALHISCLLACMRSSEWFGICCIE
jgi:hypothetical protein